MRDVIVTLAADRLDEALAAGLPLDTPLAARAGEELGAASSPDHVRIELEDGQIVDLPPIYDIYDL